jgi:hypothetical protein
MIQVVHLGPGSWFLPKGNRIPDPDPKHWFQCGSGSRDEILGQQFNKRLDHSPCYWRILKKTLLYSSFNNLYKKTAKQENSSPFMKSNL